MAIRATFFFEKNPLFGRKKIHFLAHFLDHFLDHLLEHFLDLKISRFSMKKGSIFDDFGEVLSPPPEGG